MPSAGPPTKTEIARGYDEIAERIGMSPEFYRALGRFAPTLLPPVLDVGCGGGHFLRHLLERFRISPGQLHGVDLSTRLCAIAAQRSGAKIVRGDAERLPFRSANFRTVFMIEVLEHMVAPDRVFAELHRVLRGDGTCVLSVPNRDWCRYDVYIKKHERFQPVDDRFYRLAEIESLANRASFKVVKTGGFGSLRHGETFWGALEAILLALVPSLRTKQKRLFVVLKKGRTRKILP